MNETKLERLARLSGKAASEALGALERRGYDIRGKLSSPINRVPRRGPPKPKSDEVNTGIQVARGFMATRARRGWPLDMPPSMPPLQLVSRR